MANLTEQQIKLIMEEEGEGGVLKAIALQMGSFLGGMTFGKVFRNIKGVFSKATAGAERFGEDPMAQVLFRDYVFPAVKKAEKGKVSETEVAFKLLMDSTKRLNELFLSYVTSLARLLDAKSRDEKINISDRSWSPGEIVGAPGSSTLASLATDFRAYETFPRPDVFEEIVGINGGAIVTGAIAMLSSNYDKILADPKLREVYKNGLSNLIMALNSFTTKKINMKSRFTALRAETYAKTVDLSKFMKTADDRSSGGIQMIGRFLKEVDQTAKEFEKEVEEKTGKDPEELLAVAERKEAFLNRLQDKLLSLSQGGEIILEGDAEEWEEVGIVAEFNTTANVAGYTLPLGMTNQDDPDAEMDRTVKDGGWDRLPISTDDVADDYKDDFEAGAHFLFGMR